MILVRSVGSKGDAIVLDAQDEVVVFMHDANIDAVLLVICCESVVHHIACHLLEAEPREERAAGIDTPALAEGPHLLGDGDAFVDAAHI